MKSDETRIAKLPIWAQEHIQHLEREIKRRDALVNAHALLAERDRDWFTIRGDLSGNMHLWLLNHDHPHSVCSLGPDDLLFVARAKA